MNTSNSDTTARRVIFSGHVQGVGFRWTSREIATQFPVTGYVRNLADGTVEMLVQGSIHSVEDFLEAVSGRFRNQIVDCVQQPAATDNSIETFEILR